jgi:MraZ protein
MIGFLGEYEVTLDAKGRFLLPANFKKQLPQEGANQFVISRGIEKCLTLYPIQNWEPIFSQISKLSDFDPKVRNFQRQFLNGAIQLELDSAGRLLIPKNLIEYGELEKEVIMVARIKQIEIWDKNRHKQLFETFSSEDFSNTANEIMNKPIIN